MTQSDIINNNFSKAFECIKCSNAYDTGEVLSEEKLFKQISERKHSTFDLSKFTIVGSPTITDDGVASGFSGVNYIKIPIPDLVNGNTWEIKAKFNIQNVEDNGYNTIFASSDVNQVVALTIDSNYKLAGAIGNSSGTGWQVNEASGWAGNKVTIQQNKDYWAKLVFTGTQYKILISENGKEYIETVYFNSNQKVSYNSDYNFNIGHTRGTGSGDYINGSIDLKQFSITVDGKEVFSGNKTGTDTVKIGNETVEIPYTLSKTGSKIVDVAYRDRVIDLYEQEGQAGYYTIDEPNKNFTLPMGEIYGMIGGSSSTDGSGLELCDIGMALYVDETKGLRRYLNGQIVDINTNTQAFLNRLQEITTLHPSLLCTEEEWQTAKTMSAFGQVGKFVFNYSGDEIVSVHLPRVVNVQGLFDLQNLGMTVGAGLPNIEGTVGWFRSYYHTTSGAFTDGTASGENLNMGIDTNGQAIRANFNASRSSSIYGNSTTVQPEAIQYPYFIQIATGAETENNIVNDIELNNPYSLFDSKYSDHELNNISWLKSEGQWNAKATYPTAYDKLLKVYNGTETVEGLSVKLSTETYTDYDFVLNTAEETFRLPLKTLHSDDAVDSLSLYFYVGETVQNANLIDAGRIEEQLATKTDMLQASSAGMPSGRYITLTLGASGSTYTAPANGWFYLDCATSSSLGFAEIINNTSGIATSESTNLNGRPARVYVPCSKDDSVSVYYENTSSQKLKFIYAEGSKE